jgi:ABC-2 type transport system permease protein
MFFQLVLMELRSFYRNPGIIFWAFGFPILMAGILGLAFGESKSSIKKIGVIGSNSQFIIDAYNNKNFQSKDNFQFFEIPENEAIIKYKKGEIQLYLKYENDLYNYYFDLDNSENYQTYLILDKILSNNTIQSSINKITVKGTRYIDFLIPGLLAMGIMNSCLWGSAWMLIEFRMKKLLRRMMATPLPKHIFLLSHIVSRLFLSGGEFLILILFSKLFFQTEIQGSILALALVFLSGNFFFSGLAIILSSKTTNTQIANGLINLVSFPMTLSSGIFFSYHNFPDKIEGIIQYFPLTIVADSIRSIFNEGYGISEIIYPIGILNLLGIILFFIGLKIYKWD